MPKCDKIRRSSAAPTKSTSQVRILRLFLVESNWHCNALQSLIVYFAVRNKERHSRAAYRECRPCGGCRGMRHPGESLLDAASSRTLGSPTAVWVSGVSTKAHLCADCVHPSPRVWSEIGGDLSDKPYGIGSVGFPARKLPVAEEAVSFSFRVHDVTARATESPLSPYYNPR